MHFSSNMDLNCPLWKDPDDMPESPAALLDSMSVEVASLLAAAEQTPTKVVDLEDRELETLSNNCTILLRARSIDTRLATWPDAVPSNWHPVRIAKEQISQKVINAGIYGDSCDIYPDIMICSIWNDYRVARLKVLALITDYDDGEYRSRAVREIQQLADGIAMSIPFSLGSRTKPKALYEANVDFPSLDRCPVPTTHKTVAGAYGGWYLYSPLKEVIKVGHQGLLREGQIEWFIEQIMRLAAVYDVVPD